MIRIFCCFLGLFLMSLHSSAQSDLDTIFSKLNQGALLVRLQTKSLIINKLNTENKTLANKIDDAQKIENRLIVEAFSKHLKICPVYYFYADDSKFIKAGTFDDYLMDSNLNAAVDIVKLENNYLIAEFKQAQGDTMQHQAKINTYNEQGEITETRDTNIYFHSGYSIDALILLDPGLIPLSKPYPRYVRQNIAIRARTYNEMVVLLDEKLEKFIEKKGF